MLESGILLGTFASKHLDEFSDEQLVQYDCLINLPSSDWDIFCWATGVKPTPPEFDNQVMDMLKEHAENKKGPTPIVLPIDD